MPRSSKKRSRPPKRKSKSTAGPPRKKKKGNDGRSKRSTAPSRTKRGKSDTNGNERKSSRLASKPRAKMTISEDSNDGDADSDFVAPGDFSKEILEDDVPCMICQKSDDKSELLLCDHLESEPHGGHLDCFGLARIPKRDWFCPCHDDNQVIHCMMCNKADNEDSFLLCDHKGSVDHGGHLECFGLDEMPRGKWFCPKHAHEKENNLIYCMKCHKVDDEENFILCDNLNSPDHGGHLNCFGLKSVPKRKWFCPDHAQVDSDADLDALLNAEMEAEEAAAQDEDAEPDDDEDSDRKPGELRRSKRKRSNVFRFADKMLRDFQWQGVHKKARKQQARKEAREAKAKLREKNRRPMAYGDSSGDEDSVRSDGESDDGSGKQVKPINLNDLGIYDEKAAPEYQRTQLSTQRSDSKAVKISADLDWSQIGGVRGHVQKLKEMILLPLIYPGEFKKFKIQPPRGVIFYGPPGTGKTLMARILASEASKHGKQVSFYMRKGADCLSKWIGEAEKELRKVFETAEKNSPSIIFFDEIDGLAPVRSSSQDHVHTSIVSTLLALMDGLNDRGQVVVIGATNRIDSLDPALRRPGRFDRELLFSFPSREARECILRIHTQMWKSQLPDILVQKLAERTPGFCGADLEALCREAFLNCFRRCNPAVYEHTKALKINSNLIVEEKDFIVAMREIVPCSLRSATKLSNPFPDALRPLLDNLHMQKILEIQKNTFPLGIITQSQLANLEMNTSRFRKSNTKPMSPRLLIHGAPGLAQDLYAQNLLHHLEEFPTFGIDLPSLVSIEHTHSLEEAFVETVKNARREAPSILYWPQMAKWFDMMSIPMQNCVFQLLQDLPDEVSIYVVATTDTPYDKLEKRLQFLFPRHFAVELQNPSTQLKWKFWKSVVQDIEARFLLQDDMEFLSPPAPLSPEPRSPRNNKSPPEEDFLIDKRLSQRQKDFATLRIVFRRVLDHMIKLYPKFSRPMKESKDGVGTTASLRDVRDILNSTVNIDMETFLDSTDAVVCSIRDACQDVLKNPDVSDIAKEHIADICHLQDRIMSMVLNVDLDLVKRCRPLETCEPSSPLKKLISLPPEMKDEQEHPTLDMEPAKFKKEMKEVLKELMELTKKNNVLDLREKYMRLYASAMNEMKGSKAILNLKVTMKEMKKDQGFKLPSV